MRSTFQIAKDDIIRTFVRWYTANQEDPEGAFTQESLEEMTVQEKAELATKSFMYYLDNEK